MTRFLICILWITIASCSSKQKIEDESIAFVINYAQSYSYDLQKQAYTVFSYLNRDTTVHFNLTNQEKKKIIHKYYDLDLDELEGKLRIEDECLTMPKLYTTLIVKSKSQTQEFIIDEDCKDYKSKFVSQGKRVSAFLEVVRNVLKEKPEIKKAPTSEIMYL